MFTRRIIIQKRVKDVQLGVESYQKKLNLTKPQVYFPNISTKEPYTLSFNPPGVIYDDSSNRKRQLSETIKNHYGYDQRATIGEADHAEFGKTGGCTRTWDGLQVDAEDSMT
ncbi:hypothetical protein Tco_0670197 [Tanacetum coccineum]